MLRNKVMITVLLACHPLTSVRQIFMKSFSVHNASDHSSHFQTSNTERGNHNG
uniref:Uncharacterized protein n=1 Tax=Anguilla anguilla TaxID=7936 RepID=A0A0E9WCE6_ANGAN